MGWGQESSFLTSSQVIDTTLLLQKVVRSSFQGARRPCLSSGYVAFSATPEAGRFTSSWEDRSGSQAEETAKLEPEGQVGPLRMRRTGEYFTRKIIFSPQRAPHQKACVWEKWFPVKDRSWKGNPKKALR